MEEDTISLGFVRYFQPRIDHIIPACFRPISEFFQNHSHSLALPLSPSLSLPSHLLPTPSPHCSASLAHSFPAFPCLALPFLTIPHPYPSLHHLYHPPPFRPALPHPLPAFLLLPLQQAPFLPHLPSSIHLLPPHTSHTSLYRTSIFLPLYSPSFPFTSPRCPYPLPCTRLPLPPPPHSYKFNSTVILLLLDRKHEVTFSITFFCVRVGR